MLIKASQCQYIQYPKQLCKLQMTIYKAGSNHFISFRSDHFAIFNSFSIACSSLCKKINLWLEGESKLLQGNKLIAGFSKLLQKKYIYNKYNCLYNWPKVPKNVTVFPCCTKLPFWDFYIMVSCIFVCVSWGYFPTCWLMTVAFCTFCSIFSSIKPIQKGW